MSYMCFALGMWGRGGGRVVGVDYSFTKVMTFIDNLTTGGKWSHFSQSTHKYHAVTHCT